MKNHRVKLTDIARVTLALDAANITYYRCTMNAIDSVTKTKIQTTVVQGFVFNDKGRYLFTIPASLKAPVEEQKQN